MGIEASNLIREHCSPLEPLATAVPPRLVQLPDLRAVLFDIYGTLLISASGEIGLSPAAAKAAALEAAVVAVGLKLGCQPAEAVMQFERCIDQAHTQAVTSGIAHPEVNIVEIWRAALPVVLDASSTAALQRWDTGDFERFALEYELRANPVWPMPGAAEVLDRLTGQQLPVGIVSNAQFFTPLLFPALFGRSLTELGCRSELTFFSYLFGRAKPDSTLFHLAAEALTLLGIQAREVLYVGNDMLNDVMAAAQVGFQTALFAGDSRSLRWRADDPRVAGLEPDLILTHLEQLNECVG